MAIYHLSVKVISRSKGQSATAAAAYRAGDRIVDRTTGKVNDYKKKGGVLHAEIVGSDLSREEIWNRAEEAETRKNSTVAREFEIALPAELSFEGQKELALSFARELVAKHGFVADIAIHSSGKGGDERNTHAHILCTTRKVENGVFGAKTRELDEKNSGMTDFWRNRWEELNRERGLEISAKTLAEQGIDRIPQPHFGKDITHFERRTGEKSDIRVRHEAKEAERTSPIRREVAERVAKFVAQARISDEVLNTLREVEPLEMLDWLGAYHKQVIDGSDRYTRINHKGQDFDIVIDEESKRWNDRHQERKDGEPRRIGAVSLLMHLDGCPFPEAVKRLAKMQQEMEEQRKFEEEQRLGFSR